ncbi:MAG TPA: hypothetical protein VG755_45370 [Nannocystaceae bacterium]|nr:hypothetical protein [Nannocystaceae bacterium]
MILTSACTGESLVEGTLGAAPSSSEESSSGAPPARVDADTGDESSSSSSDAESSSTDDTGDSVDDDEPVPPKQVAIAAGRTKDAERVATLPIARSEAMAPRKIVLQLAPDELPDLEVGDLLIVAAEAQVTTRCDVGQTAPGCNYDPSVRAQLIVTGDADDTDPGGPESHALADAKTQTCTKSEHHCMFVFETSDTKSLLGGGLPCITARTCHVSLVMWAWDPDARSGNVDKVLVGENEGDYLQNGVVKGDKARIVAVRERGLATGDRHEHESSGSGNVSVPSNANATLVYSHELADGLAQDEQFLIEAKFVTAVGGRARVSSKLIVSTDPSATEGNGPDAITPREIGEHNGINCTAGQSPCTTRKVAVFRASADVPGPVYVNVVVHGAVPGGGSTAITVHRGEGFVRSTRYEAEQRG